MTRFFPESMVLVIANLLYLFEIYSNALNYAFMDKNRQIGSCVNYYELLSETLM